MKKKITKEKLGKYGISIKCNRKMRLRQTGAARWTQKNFCKDICSQNALINMEKGNVGRFIENYVELAERLDLTVDDFPEIDKKIESYTKHLYKAMEFCDIKKMEKYINKFHELLGPVKKCLWYCDMESAITSIERYYLHQDYLDAQDRNYYTEMLGEFNDDWDDMIKSVVYNSAYQDVSTDEYIKRFKDFNILDNKGAFNKVNVLLYHFDNGNTAKLYAAIAKYEKEWIKKKNIIRLLDAYSINLSYASVYDVNEIEGVLARVNKLMEKNDIPEYKLSELYFCMGTAYLNLKKYNLVKEMMEQCLKYDEKKVKLAFIYYIHSQRMLNEKQIVIPEYSEEELAKFLELPQRIYHFYTMLNNRPYVELEKYLMSKLLPLLVEYNDAILIQVFKDELELIVEESGHYSIVQKYDQKTKHILPHA